MKGGRVQRAQVDECVERELPTNELSETAREDGGGR